MGPVRRPTSPARTIADVALPYYLEEARALLLEVKAGQAALKDTVDALGSDVRALQLADGVSS
jgi:hypothetical protein